MPPIVIAVVAAAAAYGGAAAAVYIGVAASMTAFGAIVAGALAGSVVAMGAGMAMQAIAGKPRTPSLEQSSSEQRQTIRAQISPRRIIYGQQRVSGPLLYAGSSGANQGLMHLVIGLAGHPVEEISTIWINDDPITFDQTSNGMAGGTVISGKYAQRASIGKFLGNQTEADPSLIAQSPDGWTADHKLLGIAYLHIGLVYDPKLYQGIPNISALVRGKNDILDPRTNQRGYSTNWALCILDYLLGDHGLACDGDELDLGSFISAANLSDEAVPLDAGGTEHQARYTLNGSFTLDAAPITIVEQMLAAGAGALVYVAGAYRLHGGAYVNPTASIGPSDFAGPVELQTMPPRAELFNGVRGTYIDPGRFWQASQFPALQDPAALAEDGEEVWRDVEFPWINDATRAQRIARQILHRMRAPLTVQAPLRYSAIQFSVHQTIAVSLPDLGWDAKPFRVAAFSFDPTNGSCTVTLTEEQVAAYAWLYDLSIGVPDSPNTTLIDPLTIPAPTGLAAVSSTAVQPDGSIAPAIEVSWVGSAHAFVSAHEVQWRVPGGAWLSRDVAMPITRLVLEPVVSGVVYEVQVRGITGLARGPWIGTSQTASADTTAPGFPHTVTTWGVLRGVTVRWTNPTDRDLAAIEVYEGPTTAAGDRVLVGETRASMFLRMGLTPGATRYYWLRARDTTGNTSIFVGPVAGTASLLLAADITDAILTTAKFAASIRPVEIIANLSATAPNDTVAINQADGKLYTRVAGAWVATVQPLGPGGTLTSAQIDSIAAAKIAGQLTNAQIADLAASKVTGQLTNAQLDAIAAAKVTGQITRTQITDGIISTPKLDAGAVTAAKIAADTITANEIAANAITATELAAGAVTTAKLVANAVTANELAANAVTAVKVSAGAIEAQAIAAGAVMTAKLSVGSGNNDIWNSCCTRTADGWVYGSIGGLAGVLGVATRDGLAAFALNALGAGYLARSTAGVASPGQALYADWSPGTGVIGIPCKAGDRLQARALLGTHRCTGHIAIIWIDGAGNGIGSPAYSPITSDKLGGAFEGEWSPHTILGTAPGGTAQALLRIEMLGTGGTDPYLFFTQALLSKAPTNATEVAPWSAGVTDISGGQVRTGTLLADAIAAGAITADKLAVNSVVAGKIAAGAVNATEIAAGAIRADKLASEEIITQTLQVANLIVGTEKISYNAVSNNAGGAWYGDSEFLGWTNLITAVFTSLPNTSRALVTGTFAGFAQSSEFTTSGESEQTYTTGAGYTIRIIRAGTVIWLGNNPITMTLNEELAPGYHQYDLQAKTGGTASPPSMGRLYKALLNILAMKR